MAYYKDPNVEKLYDIANKHNVKKKEKKQELLLDFKNTLEQNDIDINIPSRRTFTFSESSHLINVALDRKNFWLVDFIVENYEEKLNFSNHKLFLSFLQKIAETSNFQYFSKWFDKNYETAIQGFEKEKYTNNVLNFDFHRVKDFNRSLLCSSLVNKTSEIFDFLHYKQKIPFDKRMYIKTEKWFLEHELFQEYKPDIFLVNHEKENYDFLNNLLINNKLDIESTKKLIKNSFYHFDRSQTSLNIQDLKHCVNVFKHNDELCRTAVFSYLQNIYIFSREGCETKDINEIKKLSDNYLTEENLLSLFLLSHDNTIKRFDEIHKDDLFYLSEGRDLTNIIKTQICPSIAKPIVSQRNNNNPTIMQKEVIKLLFNLCPELENKDFKIDTAIIVSTIKPYGKREEELFSHKTTDMTFLNKIPDSDFIERHKMFIENNCGYEFPYYKSSFFPESCGIESFYNKHAVLSLLQKDFEIIADAFLDKDIHFNIILEELLFIKFTLLYDKKEKKVGIDEPKINERDIIRINKLLEYFPKVSKTLSLDNFNGMEKELHLLVQEGHIKRGVDFINFVQVIRNKYLLTNTIQEKNDHIGIPRKRL